MRAPTDSSRRILVIEDDGITTNALTRLIAELGVSVTSARTLADARRHSDEAWDCVLMDVVLADGSACDLIPKLKAAMPAPAIAIVTGCAEFIDRRTDQQRRNGPDRFGRSYHRESLLGIYRS